jgi:prepilin-type N-terminal cleavage/methylation domain-containing protein
MMEIIKRNFLSSFMSLNKNDDEINSKKPIAIDALSCSSSKYLRGFTLVELLVVIAIIGLLSTISVISLTNMRKQGRDAKRVADIQTLVKTLVMYQSLNSSQFPISVGECLAPDTSVGLELLNKNATKFIPVDPLTPATYRDMGPTSCFHYTSLPADGGKKFDIHFCLEVTSKAGNAGCKTMHYE